MTAAELYTKGARVWIPDKEEVWRAAELLEDYKGQDKAKLKILYEEGEESTITIKDKSKLPHLRNPEILIGENDLTSLSYLNEPEVLYNLKVRFAERNIIYTYCGIVLVAINPYEQLPLYGNDIIQEYSGQDMGAMDPHVFAVAEEAFKQMSRFDQNQSIIVSGESGAGKTVSAKYAMRYFATVGGSQAETQVEQKVLASNPIMEAIGNAKTIRNDNSSRFGKYIEINFSRQNHIIAANMRTYLLEKSRVVFQADNERNYHIFYQVCSSAHLPEFKEFGLSHQDNFWYTNQGQSPDIKDVDDAADLLETRAALSLLGVGEGHQVTLFRIISAILHFGNVQIVEKEGESCEVPAKQQSLTVMCKLLGIEESQMRMWLCNRKIQTVGETLIKPLSLAQAALARDALAKRIYAKMFDWIVTQINKALWSQQKSYKFIGVLDIYGFETFETNSFEQFCINYANEKLQQQFNMHVFKLEQEEYVREEIEWSFIDFYDNQPCIDLIEQKLGILDLLDEECKMPKGSDGTWCQKLYDKHLNKSAHFEKPRMSNIGFLIHHFADKVLYEADGFLEKNRDTVLEEHINIMKASEIELVSELFMEVEDQPPEKRPRGPSFTIKAMRETPKSSKKEHRRSVGSQFRDSLHLLMTTLNATTPHYIRCIKPNDTKSAFEFEPIRAVEQLRACGVLETIRISAAGYPSRWSYAEFYQRYRVLANRKDIKKTNSKKTCENILQKLIQDPDKYRFGKTKIFFRAGQVAYLEKLRSDKLRAAGVMIQKHVRGWLQKRRYQKIQTSVRLVQRFGRGLLARRRALYLRQTKAATRIQKTWRGFKLRKQFLSKQTAAVKIQSFARSFFARRRYKVARENAKAVIIQKMVRAWRQRRQYHRILHGLVLLQSHVRRRAAKKELKHLKIEARSVEHIKVVNKGLENKIIELQQRLDVQNKAVHEYKDQENQVKVMKQEMQKIRSTKATESTNQITDLQAEIERLRAELVKEREEKADVITEKEQLSEQHLKVVNALQEEKVKLKEEVDLVNKMIQEEENRTAEILKKKLEEASKLLMRDFESERAHHQKLVKEHARLQQRLENLQGEVQVLTSPQGKGHNRTPSNLSAISIESFSSSMTDQADKSPEEREEEPDKDVTDQGYYTSKKAKRPENLVDKVVNEVIGSKPQESMDVNLILKLQSRIRQLETQKSQLDSQLDRQEDATSPSSNKKSDITESALSTLTMQELRNENDKLKREVNKLMKSIAGSTNFDTNDESVSAAGREFMDQFEAMTDELERRREECLQLRAMLADRSIGTHALAKEFYGGQDELVNEDNEIAMAFRTQRDLNRLLQNQLEKTEKEAKSVNDALKKEIETLKKDNDRQQKLIGETLNLTPEASLEARIQHELTRLTEENLDLRETIGKQVEKIRKLKKMLKVYAKRLNDGEAAEIEAELAKEDQQDGMGVVPSLKHRSMEYMGMLEYQKDDEPMLVKHLITDLKPKLSSTLLPGLPAYIMFMCVRHTDYAHDDVKVRSLLSNTIIAVKKVIKKHTDDIERVTLWLANVCRFLHNLKQYSGEEAFQAENTAKQNEQCLRNFDLSEYRQVFSDLAIWIYQALLKTIQEKIQPMIVPAVLEHEAIAGLTASKPSGMRGRSSSTARELDDKDYSLDALMKHMNSFYRSLSAHAVDPELVKQVFRQLFYFISAGALNNLLLRKDMCNWSKGMQIRYNLSHLEQWLRDHKLQETGAHETLEPITQASQLLQARKTDADVESICEMCAKLTVAQIVKILNLYTPVDEFEERVPISFIRKIQERLKARKDMDGNNTLLMDTKYSFPVTFPYNPSGIALESVEVPTSLHLDFLKRH